MKAALIRLTAYGCAFLVGALFAFYGFVALAAQLVKNYPTK